MSNVLWPLKIESIEGEMRFYLFGFPEVGEKKLRYIYNVTEALVLVVSERTHTHTCGDSYIVTFSFCIFFLPDLSKATTSSYYIRSG